MACVGAQPQPDGPDGHSHRGRELTPDEARDYIFWAADTLNDKWVQRLAEVIRDFIEHHTAPLVVVTTWSSTVLFLA